PDDLATRYVTPTDIAWHEKSGLPAFCYAPTARGYFATGGAKAMDEYDHAESRVRLARAQVMATRMGCTPNQIALAWLRAQKFPAVPIVGPSSVEHLQDALGAAEVRLTAEEVAALAA